jgi:four helix bundle protein
MKYQDWLNDVPKEITNDRLWQSEVYRISLFLGDLAWHDSRKLTQDKSMISLADQLYRATGSISANISEGFIRMSGKDQARFYEYSLGSAREARDWYFKSRYILGLDVIKHRLGLLAQIIQLPLKMIPKYRNKKISESRVIYEPKPEKNERNELSKLLENVPISK